MCVANREVTMCPLVVFFLQMPEIIDQQMTNMMGFSFKQQNKTYIHHV